MHNSTLPLNPIPQISFMRPSGTTPIPILQISSWNLDRDSPFVKASARLSWVVTRSTIISPEATFSRTKWCLIAMCFVRAWNSGFWMSFIAELLSMTIKISATDNSGIPSSFNRLRIHTAFLIASLAIMYFASQLERATVAYRFELHDTELSANLNIQPPVDLKISEQLSQSLSIISWIVFLKCIL